MKLKKIEETSTIYFYEIDPKILKPDFPYEWNFLNNILTSWCEYLNGNDDYQKPINNLKQEDCFR